MNIYLQKGYSSFVRINNRANVLTKQEEQYQFNWKSTLLVRIQHLSWKKGSQRKAGKWIKEWLLECSRLSSDLA